MRKRRTELAVLLILLAGHCMSEQGQTSTDSAHADFSRIFFASDSAEKAARDDLFNLYKALAEFRGRVAASPANLLHVLRIEEQIEIESSKLAALYHLRNAVNSKDRESLQREQQLSADVAERTAFIRDEILGISAKRMASFMSASPALRSDRFRLEKIMRDRSHSLPVRQEELLNSLQPELTGWQSEFYDEQLAHTRFEPVVVGGKPLDPQKERTQLSASSDADVRSKAFHERYQGFRRDEAMYALILLSLANASNHNAAIHKYSDAPSQFYAERFLTKDDVRLLLKQVAEAAGVYKGYQQIRAEHVKAWLHLPAANAWDMNVPIGSGPQLSLPASREILAKALAPLGAEYMAEMANLLDPANGRIDVGPGESRKPGGFSLGFRGFPTVLYAGRFTGSYNDVRVLAHEGGHAVHRSLMDHAGVKTSYLSGPNFLFESFAVLNELLLADYLYEQERDPIRKTFYLEQFLDGKGTIAFVAGAEADLEEAVYEGAQSGKVRSAEDIDKLTEKIYSKYSIWPEKTPELRYQWMAVPLMYEDPFYDINYVYAGVLGLKYYELFKQDPAAFQPRYIALLKNGFDAPPDALLKRFLGIDLHDPLLFADSMRVLKPKIDQLKVLYSQTQPTAAN